MRATWVCTCKYLRIMGGTGNLPVLTSLDDSLDCTATVILVFTWSTTLFPVNLIRGTVLVLPYPDANRNRDETRQDETDNSRLRDPVPLATCQDRYIQSTAHHVIIHYYFRMRNTPEEEQMS